MATKREWVNKLKGNELVDRAHSYLKQGMAHVALNNPCIQSEIRRIQPFLWIQKPPLTKPAPASVIDAFDSPLTLAIILCYTLEAIHHIPKRNLHATQRRCRNSCSA